MAIILVQHTIPRDTGDTADIVANTFHFLSSAPNVSAPDVTSVIDAVHAFFNTAGPVGSAVRVALSSALDPAGARIKVYDLDDPMPRVPLADVSRPLGSLGSSALPAEMAICLSYKGIPAAGVRPGRNRGRTYIGPLQAGATIVTAGEARPAGGIRADILSAAKRLMDWDSANPIHVEWSIYSRLDNAIRRIQECWVDDAFDVQRRRGARPTTRETVVTGP